MNVIDRVLMVLFALAGIAAAVILFLIGVMSPGGIGQTLLATLTGFPGDVYAIVIGILWFLIGLRFLFYRVRRPEEDHVVLQGEHGNIRISFEAIRQLSNRTGKAVRGVQEFDTRVRTGQAGVWLAVRVKALADLDLAEMSRRLQSEIKAYVEQSTGVTVERITVNIAELANTPAKANKAWVD
ncbi:MAG: alkaline shock response membrane anchor protein AmaP [Alicyclobacillus sp.]|nr:alkaline shock response membrane anchor protein AmaP [Alicyclobacillus sp.]